MQTYRFSADFPDRLLRLLGDSRSVLGPVLGDDGVCRLQNVDRWPAISVPPLLPAKKVLLPPQERLWSWREGEISSPGQEPALALAGLFPCDLYALAYLDRVFAEDEAYHRRRRDLLLVGAACTPSEECFCPPRSEPPPFDLFLTKERVWAGSVAGAAVLDDLAEDLDSAEEMNLPPEIFAGRAESPPDDLAERFSRADREMWRRVGERCVSCGACSAVCPTCYCFAVVDTATLDGRVERRREWDNCFFRSHALVAGGHNFRPGRAERLRFRFEHKYLGLGDLRGVSSCVGCGRCRRACPVDIDLAEVLVTVTGEDR